MNEQAFFHILIIGWFAIIAAISIASLFVLAPYGRYMRSGWGPTINRKLGWVIMEGTSPLVFAAFFALGSQRTTAAELVFFSLWELHYIHRAFIYPFTLRGTAEQMPVSIVAMGFLFNGINGYVNSRYIFTFSGGYANQWLADPRFVVGMVLFLMGFIVNRQADHTLRNLRKPDEPGYKIPFGGLYRWISCPNYFGEIIEWIGWAVATWSLPGLAFAIWTTGNIAPRARAHHAWYREHFPDYPPERKALLPGVW